MTRISKGAETGSNKTVPQVPLPLLFRVFLPFASGYFLSDLFRMVNAVIAPDLAADTGVDPAQLGLLTATYLITFAAFQLPLGILLDRFGPRTVEAVLLLFAAAGAAVFALSTTLSGLIIGRALIGFGVSACLMAAFKSHVIWFPGPMLPRINGFQMAAGGLGVLAAFTPVELALRFTDWRGVFMGLSVMCVLMAVTVFTVVPESRLTLSFASRLSGRVTTSINLLVFLCGFVLQWAMGTVINQWDPPLPGHYDPAGYRTAFLMVLGLQVLGLAWFFISLPLKARPSNRTDKR
jgi:MFS family permease